MPNFTMYDREREFKWQIECQLSGGTYAYIDAEDIYSGRLTRQISSGEGIEVGSCYVSELDLTIVASALPSNVVSVKPYFRLLTSTEIVDDVVQKYYTGYNLGVFKIASTKRKEYGRIDLVCYDKMADLDTLIAPAAYTELLASDWKPFYLLDWIATKVGVTYTFTQAGIEAMPNGTLYFKLAEETSNIKTYRDLLQYVCMLIGAYAIFDEDGHLNVKTFADVTSYSLPASFRFSESFGDVPITYSGVELTVKNATTMFGNANNTVVRLSDNPFLYSLSTLNQTTDYATFIMQFLRNIYIEFQGLSYYAGEFEIPPDASLNVGRLLAVTGGGASNTINCFLQKIDVNFDGRMMLSCGNPNTYVTRTQNRTTSSITNLTNRIETLESSQGGGGNKVYISELAPTVEDNAIGNEGDLWYKVKRRGHFEGAVLKCIRAGIMTEPNMSFSVGQYVRVNYGNYYNNNAPCLKYVDESWAGYNGYEYISLSASGITNARTNGATSALWGHMIMQEGSGSSQLYGIQSLRLWTCNYDEERMITSNESAVGGFGRTAVGYDISYQGKNYYRWSTESIAGILTSVYYDAATSDEHMVDPAAVQAVFDSFALFEIVDWGEGTNFNYDGTIIERMVLERYIKYDGVWVKADYKAGKGIIIGDGEISVDVSTSVDIVQNVTSGTQLATINGTSVYAPTVSASQTLSSGTEIGTVTVGSASTTLYAPTPQSVSVTQTLTSGTEIGSVTIDNTTTTLYAPSGGGGGSTVTVTPKTSTGTNIADISVDGTTYQLFAPSGGGGGGSGSGYTADLLFENTDFSVASGTSNVSLDYTLSASIDDYDAVIVSAFLVNKGSTREQVETIIINKSQYYTRAISSGTDDYNTRWTFKLNGTYQNVIRDLYFGFADNTTLKTLCRRSNSGEEPKLYRVYGLKFGGSSGYNYSTTEQVIGTWIDGSTIYEKTQYGGITFSTQGTWYDTDITNIDKVVSVEGSINKDGEPINLGYWNSSIVSCWVLRNHTLKMCMQAMASGETYTLNSVTVRYTKTS